MKKVLCLFCLLLCGILPSTAQSESQPKASRSAWFACLSAIPDGVENPVKVMIGKDVVEIELKRYMTSEPVKIPDDGIIRIVREVPNPENPEKPNYLVLSKTKIPESMGEALIILAPLAKPKGDLIFLSKVQDLANFKGGDRLYINLSNTLISVKLGKSKVTVKPKSSSMYQAPALTKPTSIPIMYGFYHPEQKKWKMFSASTVVLRPTRRKICIFNDGTRIGNIKKHSILFPVQAKKP